MKRVFAPGAIAGGFIMAYAAKAMPEMM